MLSFLSIAIAINKQDIFGLQVPVDDAVGVNKDQGVQDGVDDLLGKGDGHAIRVAADDVV